MPPSAYAVAIAVHERARIDLIDDPTLPPSELNEFFNSGFVIHVTLRILAYHQRPIQHFQSLASVVALKFAE